MQQQHIVEFNVRACVWLPPPLLHAVPSLLDVLLVLLLVLRLQQLYGAVLSTALPASVHLPACENSLEGAASQKEPQEFWNIWIGNSLGMPLAGSDVSARDPGSNGSSVKIRHRRREATHDFT